MDHQTLFVINDILGHLLNWPFLAFILILAILILFGNNLKNILDKGEITIIWGPDQQIKLSNLSDKIDEELDPIKEDIQALKDEISKQVIDSNTDEPEQKELYGSKSIDDYQAISEKLDKELRYHRYRWRSIERLAIAVGLSENDVLDILSSNPNVVLSVGKTKRRIARLKDR